MTKTAWKKIRQKLLRGESVDLPDGSEIVVFDCLYGPEYSLRKADGNCVVCTWDLTEIEELVVV